MSSQRNDSPRKGLWPVYAFGAFMAVGFVLAALGVRTCL